MGRSFWQLLKEAKLLPPAIKTRPSKPYTAILLAKLLSQSWQMERAAPEGHIVLVSTSRFKSRHHFSGTSVSNFCSFTCSDLTKQHSYSMRTCKSTTGSKKLLCSQEFKPTPSAWESPEQKWKTSLHERDHILNRQGFTCNSFKVWKCNLNS